MGLNQPEMLGKSRRCTLSNSSSNMETMWWDMPRFSSRLAYVVLLTRYENLEHSSKMTKCRGTVVVAERSRMLSTVLLKNWPVDGHPV